MISIYNLNVPSISNALLIYQGFLPELKYLVYNEEWILHRFDCQSPIEIKNNYYKQLNKCA